MLHELQGIAVCSAVFVALGFGGGRAIASDPGEQTTYVEGYLDEAPADAEPVETIEITRDGRERVLIIVTARSAGRERVAFGGEAGELPLQVRGAKKEVSELMTSNPGERIRATMKYYPASRAVLIQDIDS